MKKMISMAVMAMVMGMSSMAYAADMALTNEVKVVTKAGTKSYAAGTQGVVSEGHTFATDITIDGTTYPAGTKFKVITTKAGEVVPVSATKGAVAATGAAAGTGFTTAAVGTTAVFAGLVAVMTKKNNATTSASVSGT